MLIDCGSVNARKRGTACGCLMLEKLKSKLAVEQFDLKI
jgi:hypothetical protein